MAVDLLNILCLDPKHTSSPYGGQFRQILLSRTYDNTSDFVFHNLLQHFGRREPNSVVLLITLSHDWSNYSVASAKCGFNLRRLENGGNVLVIDIMRKFLQDTQSGQDEDYCNFIQDRFKQFIDGRSEDAMKKPIIVMFDDLSILTSIGYDPSKIFKLVTSIAKKLRDQSAHLAKNQSNHLIVQTSSDLNGSLCNLQNMSDIYLILRPLETGHSTRVDGTITISDYRLPKKNDQQQAPSLLMPQTGGIGYKKSYFYKLGDRRVRLTTSALIL